MPEDNEISVEQLEQQLKRKGIPLPFEIGAFIALEVCEQIVRAPTHVGAADVWIGEIGEILVESGGARAAEADAVRATLRLLSDLLVCSAPGVPPMLLELIEHGPSANDWTLSRLRDDLEACLLPLNRGATRRVLARLLREVNRQGDRGSLRPSGAPDAAALDAELDNLLGIAPGELPPSKVPLVQPPAREPEPEPEFEAEPEPEPEPKAKRAAPKRGPAIPSLPATSKAPAGAPAPVLRADPRAPQPSAAAPATPLPEKGPRLRTEDLFEEPESRRASGGLVIGGLFFLIAVVLGVAYLTLGQLGARKLFGLPTNTGAPPAPPPSAAAARPASGELQVTSTPGRAQVFLFVGQGPALATDLALGVAQEFVAIADGHAPARAVVPANAAWEQGTPGDATSQPRYELAMQAGKQVEPGGETELGATLLTQDTGTPNGSLGTVRVITTPPGAKVYQLIGWTPDVRVSGLKLDRSYEVLIYAPGYALQTSAVQARDFKGEGPERVALVNVTLNKRKR